MDYNQTRAWVLNYLSMVGQVDFLDQALDIILNYPLPAPLLADGWELVLRMGLSGYGATGVDLTRNEPSYPITSYRTKGEALLPLIVSAWHVPVGNGAARLILHRLNTPPLPNPDPNVYHDISYFFGLADKIGGAWLKNLPESDESMIWNAVRPNSNIIHDDSLDNILTEVTQEGKLSFTWQPLHLDLDWLTLIFSNPNPPQEDESHDPKN